MTSVDIRIPFLRRSPRAQVFPTPVATCPDVGTFKVTWTVEEGHANYDSPLQLSGWVHEDSPTLVLGTQWEGGLCIHELDLLQRQSEEGLGSFPSAYAFGITETGVTG